MTHRRQAAWTAVYTRALSLSAPPTWARYAWGIGTLMWLRADC
jgi:hypothetical protein